MDIPRPDAARSRRIRRFVYAGIILLAIPLVTWALSRLKPAAPNVERATVWIDSVKRGQMLRQVRGLGTLVPEEIRWIPATTQGRVERRLIQPGTQVRPETILLELSNPELEQSALDAELQLKASEADYANLKVQLETELLNQQAGAATVQADYHQAKLQAEVDEQLAKEGLTSELNWKRSKVRADELATRNEIEKKRLEIRAESVRARLAAQQAQVDQRRALYELRKRQLDELKVRAGVEGVLQLLPVEVGQQVAPGTNLARVANPSRLKAEIRIPETQAKDVLIGQKAEVDLRTGGVVPGRVVRIDPAVQQGTVTVDVAFHAPLPSGARPDLSVDGTIEIERLENVLFVGRPVQGQANTTVGLFKLGEGGEAVRVQVKLGRSSVNTIEILDGLQEGDQVVLSDMSNWDSFDRIRLR